MQWTFIGSCDKLIRVGTNIEKFEEQASMLEYRFPIMIKVGEE